jgi:nicotinamide-nucleotide amidase
MNAEIIAAGSELLTPARSDTNSLWLTARLNELGVEVTQKTIVGDDRERLAGAVRGALERVEIVIVTGGLGPTEDDVTREAVALALGRGLEFSEQIYGWIQQRFARFGRRMAEINRRQAFLIAGAEKLENPNGTAPGQWIDAGGKMIALLPGPPGEMKPVFEKACVARLRDRLPRASIGTRCYRVAGMGESDVDQLIAPLYKPYAGVVTTILAAAGDIQIHLRARAGTAAQAEALVAEVGAKIEATLGERIYSNDGAPLENVVGERLKRRGETVAVAESCTAGLLGARITDVAGASAWFAGGFLVYQTVMKTRLLGVDAELIEAQGVVSEAVARALAASARGRTGATWALAVTGAAGPEAASGAEPGTVWIGLAGPGGTEAQRYRFPGERGRVRAFAAQSALNLLRLRLEGADAALGRYPQPA